MNPLARLRQQGVILSARVMHRWDETRAAGRNVRLFVYCSILALPDEPALVGVAGKRRGHAPMSPVDPRVALDFWQRCVGEWTLSALAQRRHITLDSWKPARRDRPVFTARASRR